MKTRKQRYIYEITEAYDGSGDLAGGALNDFSKACIAGFDLEGKTIWSNIFAYIDSGRSGACGVAPLPDSYLVTSYTCDRFPEDRGDAYLVKTDLHGEVLHDTTYGWTNSAENALDVDAEPRGGGYVAGRTFGKGTPSSQPDFYVIRTNPNGGQ